MTRMPEVSVTSNDRFLRIVANTVLATALMPYVSPLPWRGMDVQLTAVATASAALLFLFVFAPRRLTIQRTDIVVLLCGLAMLFYVNFNHVDPGLNWMRACATILLGFPVYFAVRNLYRYMSPGVLVAVVATYTSVLVFQLTFPSAYVAIFSHLMSELRWEPGGYRGPNGLCVEPAMLASMCILFVISKYFLHRQFWQEHRGASWFVAVASVAMLIVSQSATGCVLAVVMAFVGLLVSRRPFKVKAAAIIAVCLLLGFAGTLAVSGSGRGTEFLSAAAKNPAVVLQDPSFAMRFVGVFLGLHGLSSAPLGTGELVLDQKLADKAWESKSMITLWPDPLLRQYVRDYVATFAEHSNASGIGPVIQRMGVLALIVFATLIRCVRGFPEKWVVRVFLLTLFLSASLFISTLWFILGCCAAIWPREDADTLALAHLRTELG